MFVLVTIMVSSVYAETSLTEGSVQDEESVSATVTEPLDFITSTPGTSGDGWTWDQNTLTLTLDGLKMNLTQYAGQPYTAGINLPDGSTVDVQGDSGIALIGMQRKRCRSSAKPYEDPEYAGGIYGISSNTYINMKNSSLTASVNGDKWVGTAYGALALTNMTLDNCAANIAVSGSERAYGLATNYDQKLKSSKVDVVTKYVSNIDSGYSYGILGSNMNLDVSKDGSHIKANTTNANGIAFIATTGDTGNTPKSYDPSYKAKMIKGSYDVVQPQNAAISIASIPGGQHPYVDLETFYNTKNTSKPASAVELAIVQPAPAPVVTTVTVNSKTVTAASLKKQ